LSQLVPSTLGGIDATVSRHLLTESTATALSLTDAYVKLPAEFTDLRMLYRISMTVPVTTATVERGFSKFTYVKNKLRSTMTQDRLESLILATAEKDILLQLPNEDLVAKFAGAADRRLDLGENGVLLTHTHSSNCTYCIIITIIIIIITVYYCQ